MNIRDFDRDTARWFTSTRSNGNGGNCVEAARLDDGMAVRDSKDPQGPVLRFTSGGWAAFVGGLRDGKFDL
jgi:hypothetical protein